MWNDFMRVLAPARNELLWLEQPSQDDSEGEQQKELVLVAELGGSGACGFPLCLEGEMA